MTSLIGERHEIDLGMSNLDHSIDEGLAEALKADPQAIAHYAAWNFSGYVWYENGSFSCEVWRYNAPIALVMAFDLETLMETVSDEYGGD